MIPAITEINFPAYATLHQATVSLSEMGDRVITTQVRIDGDVVPDFSGWELSFKGERFVLNTKEPQAVKDNSTRNSLVDLTFESWVARELKRYFFFEAASVNASTAIADKYKASVNLGIEDFVVLYNKVLDYYFGGNVVMSLYMSGQGQYSTDRALMEGLGVPCIAGSTPEAVCEAAAGCGAVLSSRLHLLILAANVGTPVFGISRGEKIANWLVNTAI